MDGYHVELSECEVWGIERELARERERESSKNTTGIRRECYHYVNIWHSTTLICTKTATIDKSFADMYVMFLAMTVRGREFSLDNRTIQISM